MCFWIFGDCIGKGKCEQEAYSTNESRSKEKFLCILPCVRIPQRLQMDGDEWLEPNFWESRVFGNVKVEYLKSNLNMPMIMPKVIMTERLLKCHQIIENISESSIVNLIGLQSARQLKETSIKICILSSVRV